jgi:hypothetical protein
MLDVSNENGEIHLKLANYPHEGSYRAMAMNFRYKGFKSVRVHA